MQNLILVFVRFGGLILFGFLELLCFYLIIQYNQKQSLIAFSSANRVAGQFYETRDDIAGYFNLSAVSDSLARENARLKSQLDNAKYLKTILKDTVRSEDLQQQYTFTAAKVIRNSISKNNNSITLDRGSLQGITSHSGVIGNTGIVGIVRRVSPHYAQVMSLLHRQTKISAAVKRNNYFGSLVWKGNDPKVMWLEDVPKHAAIVVGDTIQTSGQSAMFPEGILIGKIDTFWEIKGDNSYEIKVDLINDLSNVKYVYVVNDLFKEEREKLEGEVMNE